ncbi:MAG: class I SAM-dependent methyltransferase [Rubrobacter sp.]|nr:class I SAM-dependent methyltransferase [Rubrobacter sp.]
MTADRNHLRNTFDSVASLYDAVRPGYPDALFEDVISLSGIPPGGRILEIGSGTGQATLPLARRGYEMLCIELGESLADIARQNLSEYPRVEILTADFEDWPVEKGAFDLAVSAEAFHWLDPAVAYRKVFRALKPGGAMALFWNRHVWSERSERFFEAAQKVYERETPEIVKPEDHKGLSHPEEVSGRMDGIDETGLFGEVMVRKYPWEAEYDAAGYIRLLNTYSGHIALDDDARNRLFRGITDLIEAEFDGRIVKQYLTVLYVANAENL